MFIFTEEGQFTYIYIKQNQRKQGQSDFSPVIEEVNPQTCEIKLTEEPLGDL